MINYLEGTEPLARRLKIELCSAFKILIGSARCVVLGDLRNIVRIGAALDHTEANLLSVLGKWLLYHRQHGLQVDEKLGSFLPRTHPLPLILGCTCGYPVAPFASHE